MAVGSVVNALAILRHLAGGEVAGVNVIARALSISPSTCFNILRTLVGEGFVDFDPDSKLYSLGTEPARIFGGESPLPAWRQWVTERLASLADEHSLTCGLWRAAGNRMILTDVAEGAHATRIHLAVGQRLPMFLGAMGRCIAANCELDRATVKEDILSLRWADTPRLDRYMADMKDARRQGWAVDNGNYLRGVTTVASAVKDLSGDIRACMTATMFQGQHSESNVRMIAERLTEFAALAQDRLNGTVHTKAA